MGAHCVICARKAERAEETAAHLRKLGVRTLAVGCDVTDAASVQAVVDETVSELGRIDILVDNPEFPGPRQSRTCAFGLEQSFQHERDRHVPVHAGRGENHDRARPGENHQHGIRCGNGGSARGSPAGGRVSRQQGSGDRVHEVRVQMGAA